MREYKPTSLADQVFERLENDIIMGTIARGEVLTELKLVELLGVSRTPIREALRRLSQERIIEEVSKGSRVLGISPEELKQIYEKKHGQRGGFQERLLLICRVDECL